MPVYVYFGARHSLVNDVTKLEGNRTSKWNSARVL